MYDESKQQLIEMVDVSTNCVQNLSEFSHSLNDIKQSILYKNVAVNKIDELSKILYYELSYKHNI